MGAKTGETAPHVTRCDCFAAAPCRSYSLLRCKFQPERLSKTLALTRSEAHVPGGVRFLDGKKTEDSCYS